MQLGYTILNLALLWVNTYATFKTLNRRSVGGGQSSRSSRLQQRSKREMKSCLSVWVVWVSWTFIERIIDATVGMFIPFLHEIKCLFILLLIVTRPWGTEPLVLNVLRPAIRPYTGIIDACLHWLELGGDFLFLLVSLPYHMLVSWWNSTGDEPLSPVKATVGDTEYKKKVVGVPPPPFPEAMPPENRTPASSVEDVSATTRAAIEAHRKEQEEQAADEIKLKEIQARSAHDRAAHLRRVAGPAPPVQYNNAPTSRTLREAMQDVTVAPPSDLPASAINLSKGAVGSSRNATRDQIPFSRPSVMQTGRTKQAAGGAEASVPSIYPRAALAMPVPVRAQRPSSRPAVHLNASAAITRPSNPAPQIPSVVIPMSSQTLPRPPRMRPPAHLSQTAGARSSSTLRSNSSGSTLPVDEFGVGVSGHRRESADDDTADGESQEGSSQDANAKGQRWEDFMASLERSHLTATLPRGTGGTQMNGSTRRDGATGATRGAEEMVERIAGIKREVDEKLQQIAAHSGKILPAQSSSTQTRQREVPRARAGVSSNVATSSAQSSARGRSAGRVQPVVPSNNNEMETAPRIRGEPGHKRSRKRSGHFSAMTGSEEESGSDEEDAERSPKKRRKDLEVRDEMDVDGATMVTDSVEGSRSSRPVRTVVAKAKEKIAPVAPAVSRSGTTTRTARGVVKKPVEPAVVPSIGTRSRTRRAMVS